MTTVYLMRHSETLKSNNINNLDDLQLQNEKTPLSINGGVMAKEKTKIKELTNADIVISSKYLRAILTAKYFTKDKFNIIEEFDERKYGINSWNELPNDFEEKQFNDFDYKIGDGESLNDVIKREEQALNHLLEQYKNKKILIVGHATSFTALLSKWCEINYLCSYKFNGKEFFDGHWNYLETFKLIFDDNKKLISIENIK